MQTPEQLLGYFQTGIDALLKTGQLQTGEEFRKTQKEALQAYQRYLADERLTPAERLKGYFEIPTGIGKTALFIAILAATKQAATDNGQELKTIILVPTCNLLDQTRESFNDYASGLCNQIGLYGDGHKDLSQSITIMTYDAWATLTESGQIGSHNVDILISDEAHRATSQNRLDLMEYFNETARIAVTATAHFDEEKSVEASYERKIYGKLLPDAVREGELCSYIQAQTHEVEIKVPKNLKNKFETKEPEVRAAYRKKLRQTMWNKTAHFLFRKGRDERTGDHLSDNKAGFFVEGIEQADELEKMLNEDPVLQAKMTKLGCKHVALAIHSRLPRDEQKRRHELYRQGKVMAIIGDEQFKEGSDYPHMKTIFDTKHASLVDKVQIIGRGARYWKNPANNNRDEGLTFVDIVTYLQGANEKETQSNREIALCDAIRARDVLQGDVILSEKIHTERENGGSGSKGKILVEINGAKVKSYTALEDLFELSRDISELNREHYMELDAELKAKLQRQANRVGGARAISRNMPTRPEGLTDALIYNIIFGLQRTAYPVYVQAILETSQSMPDATKRKITEEESAIIKREVERTGIKARALFELMENKPNGISKGIIQSVVSGDRKDEIEEEYIFAIIKTYASLRFLTPQEKTAFVSYGKKRSVNASTVLEEMQKFGEALDLSELRRLLDGANTIFKKKTIEAALEYTDFKRLITEEEKEIFRKEKERTSVAADALLSKMSYIPKGLNAKIASGIINGKSDTGRGIYVKALLKGYSPLPNGKIKIPFTEEMKEWLVSQIKRTGIANTKKIDFVDPLEGLTPSVMRSLVYGHVQTVDEGLWHKLKIRYQASPDKAQTISGLSDPSLSPL